MHARTPCRESGPRGETPVAILSIPSRMLDPAPTTKLPPSQARGRLASVREATATEPSMIEVTFYNTDYRLHLIPVGAVTASVGDRIEGQIAADAKRVDTVNSGGRYVEPVIGRPRRVQGSVVAVDASSNSITVNAGMPIVCRLTDPRQRASDFERGDFVSFDVMRGATFEQRGA